MSVRFSLALPLAIGWVGLPMKNMAVAQTSAVKAAPASQAPASVKPSSSNRSAKSSRVGWRLSPALGVDAQYDNNVFLLDTLKRIDVAAPSAADATSGRYNDMKSASDVLTTVAAGVSLRGPGLMGKTSVIAPELSYEYYAKNTARSNVSLGLSLQQDLWADSRLRIQGRLTPNYFARNYMVDAIDLNTDGSIAAGERVYASGDYREGELGASYRLPFAKSNRKRPLGAALQVSGGYYKRSFDAPLSARDMSGPIAGGKLLIDLGRRVAFNLGYDYAALTTTPSNQVLLLDEPVFGQDLNGNGTVTDLNARAFTMVDRSRREQSLGASVRMELSKPVDLTLDYEHRWRRYNSVELLDVSNRGRRDTRKQASADLRVRVTKDLRLRLGGTHSSQRLNRTGDPGAAGEIDDYSRSQGRLGLSYEL